jgi:ribose transport system substrate-binding protein
VFTKNLTNPYFQAVRVGSETAAKALGVKVIQYIPTKPDSIPEQLSQVEDVIVKKPDAIVFIPVDYKALVPAIEKINAAGIPVVNITDRSSGRQFRAVSSMAAMPAMNPTHEQFGRLQDVASSQ